MLFSLDKKQTACLQTPPVSVLINSCFQGGISKRPIKRCAKGRVITVISARKLTLVAICTPNLIVSNAYGCSSPNIYFDWFIKKYRQTAAGGKKKNIKNKELTMDSVSHVSTPGWQITDGLQAFKTNGWSTEECVPLHLSSDVWAMTVRRLYTCFLTAHRQTKFLLHLFNKVIKKKTLKEITISTASIRQSYHDLGIFVDWMPQRQQKRTVADEKQEWDCQGDTMKLSRPWITGVFVFHTNNRIRKCKQKSVTMMSTFCLHLSKPHLVKWQ